MDNRSNNNASQLSPTSGALTSTIQRGSTTSIQGSNRFVSALAAFAAMSPEEQAEQKRRAEELQRQDDLAVQRRVAHNERLGYTSLTEPEWAVTFANLKVIDQNRNAIERVQKWSPDMKKGVVLYGTVGTGKSTLCKAVINKFASMTYRCKFVSVAEAIRVIRAAIDKPGTNVDAECQKLVAPDLLVFDDLGVDGATDWSREQLFAIFDARNRAGKHTWFTTNLSPDQMREIYQPRIADRMFEFCTFVAMSGQSLRGKFYESEI